MKKTSKIKLILNLVFIICFSSSLLSQWAITPKNGTIGNDYLFKIDENCEYKACFTTYLYSPESPPFAGDDSFIPSMFLRISILDIDQIFHLTNWVIETNAIYPNEIPVVGVEGLYKSKICVTVDLSNQCLSSFQSEDDPTPLDPSSTVLISYLKQLLASDGVGGYEPYPICSFVHPEEMFSCEIFGHTEQFCEDPEPSCNNSSLYSQNGNLQLECEYCVLANLGGGKGKLKGGNEIGNKRNQKISSINISPNPFIDNIYLTNLKEDANTEIRIINNMGQVVKSLKTNAPQQSISTKELSNGIYILMVYAEGSVESFKILKQ